VNLNEYEKQFFSTYEAFAETVRFILEKALRADEKLPRPQAIQSRAKAADSLRHRLAEVKKLSTQTLELDRRDLAGVRLIFYTNNDVDRFLASRLLHKNFEIEDDSTKVHHPTQENKGKQYRAVHFTALLRSERTSLPEYANFTGLRCEIQIQTILNHAWSETSHDVLYKHLLADGYGGKAMQAIAARFSRIMDNYLIPAGFEIQMVQQEYERVIQGKALFDADIAVLLENAQNNNERYEILLGLKDYAIPNYDDLQGAYDGLKGPLLRAVEIARVTELVPIETAFGTMEGFKADTVTKLVVEIGDCFRYIDVTATLQLFINIYREEPSETIREQILHAVKKLAEYKIDTYNQVGATPQIALLDHLAGMSDAEVDNIGLIALTVWTEAIRSDITGAKWKADSVVFMTGALPLSQQIMDVRERALNALFSAYDRSADDAHKRAIFSALDAATRTPYQAQYSNELLAATVKDATRIVSFVTERALATSYELLQHLENQFLYYYRRAESLAADPENRFGCQTEAAVLVTTISAFRETINANDRFVRYKVLVGFESVYPGHWTGMGFDYQAAEEYRRAQASLYIDEIDAANENEWFDLITRCAQAKSGDLATFPFFGNFISNLAERKPDIADRFITKASDDLRHFLAGFLNGLARSGRSDIYERILESELESNRSLAGVARHLRFSDVKKPGFAVRLLKRAIDSGDSTVVIESVLLVVEHYGASKVPDADSFLHDALSFLNEQKDSRWVSEAWFLDAQEFYAGLSRERAAQVLKNLVYHPQVNYQVERVLARLAERHPDAIWDYFAARLDRAAVARINEERFEAVPFQFHGLEKMLSKDPKLAITKGLSWFADDQDFFAFRGGRVLSSTFPHCTPEFGAALVELVKAGGDTEAKFALAILENYHGETSTHGVLKEIVSLFPEDSIKMIGVRTIIDNTGVVTGEMGFVEAWRSRKEALTEWLGDHRTSVKEFAEKHIRELDLQIASEQRHAEADREMRNRRYE
jgi:ppGpp synthetase/RelA/SpoT-type nucleotidyltranferase